MWTDKKVRIEYMLSDKAGFGTIQNQEILIFLDGRNFIGVAKTSLFGLKRQLTYQEDFPIGFKS